MDMSCLAQAMTDTCAYGLHGFPFIVCMHSERDRHVRIYA